MNCLTRKNVQNIYEQNYKHFLKLQKRYKKKFNRSVREKYKYKLYYEAQFQLNFSSPQCCLTILDEDEVKLSELHKIYEQRNSTSITKNSETENLSATIPITDSNTTINQKLENSNISPDIREDLTKENIEIVENLSLSSSGYSSPYAVPSSSSKENLDSTAGSTEKNIETYEEDDPNDDYIQIVNAVHSESQDDAKNQNYAEKISLSELQNDNTSAIRRTSRTRKPVLYSEALTHIQFIGSPKHCNNSNVKHSLSASSNNSLASRKRRKINNSTTNIDTTNIDTSYLQMTPTTSLNIKNATKNRNIFNEEATQINNYIKIRPLPKGSQGSYLEVAVGESFARQINEMPVRVIVGLMEPPQREVTTEDQETVAAVASINLETSNLNLQNATINAVKPRKTARKSRNNTKKSKTSEQPKSDLAKYIETFGDVASCNIMDSGYNNQSQQIPNLSPQNAGISTTTCEFGNSTTVDLTNAEWRTISNMPNSNAITINEMLNGNQLEGELENENLFNILNFFEGDNNVLISNTASENNNLQQSTTASTQNIILKTSLPGDITSTTTSSPRDITSTNHYILNRPLPEDTSYNMNNIFLHQPSPSAPPQPVIKNHYERATLSRNFQPPPTGQYQLINAPLPPAHQSSIIHNQQSQIANMMNVLDLSQKQHNLMESRIAKQELISYNTNKPHKTKILSLEDYKKRQLGISSNTDIITRGRDMPILVEDRIEAVHDTVEKNKNTLKLNKCTDIILSSNSKINCKEEISVSSNLKQSETNDMKRKNEIVESQIVNIAENQIGNDKNLSLANCNNVILPEKGNNKNSNDPILNEKNEIANGNDAILNEKNEIANGNDAILNEKNENNKEKLTISNVHIIDNSNEEKVLENINNNNEFDGKKSVDKTELKSNNSKTIDDKKSLAKTDLKSNNSKSIDEPTENLSVRETETKSNNKSINEINVTQCIDEYLSMKDNADLDYEQEVDWDCLIINASPACGFGNDDEETTTIQNNNLKIPSKSSEFTNIHEETSDIFGIIRKNQSEKEKPSQETKTTVQNNKLKIHSKSPELRNIHEETTDIFGIIRKKQSEEKLSQEITTANTNNNINSERQLKDFKIPKININSKHDENTCSSSTIVKTAGLVYPTLNRTSVLNFNEEISEKPQLLRCWPNNPTNILKLPTQISNELHPRISVASLFSNSFSTTVQMPESGNILSHTENRGRFTGNISHVFGSPCYSWLNANCTKDNCRFKHFLVDEASVKATLLELSDQYIERAYFETTKFFKLFKKYFVMFCQLFKNNVEMLKIIIVDCQKYAKRTDFLEPFRDGLNEVGWTKIDAVNLIINNWNDNSHISVNRIIELVIDTDPAAFLGLLEHYSKLPNYQYQVESIIKLAAIYNNYKNYDLMQILMNIVTKIPPEELLQENKYNNDELIKFLELVKNFNMYTHCPSNNVTNTHFPSNNIQNIICNVPVSAPVYIEPQLQQRTIKNDNLSVILNQQLQPGHQNLFIHK